MTSESSTRSIHLQRSVMKNFAIGLLGAAAVTTTILLVRQQKDGYGRIYRLMPAGGSPSSTFSLERIRELGL